MDYFNRLDDWEMEIEIANHLKDIKKCLVFANNGEFIHCVDGYHLTDTDKCLRYLLNQCGEDWNWGDLSSVAIENKDETAELNKNYNSTVYIKYVLTERSKKALIDELNRQKAHLESMLQDFLEKKEREAKQKEIRKNKVSRIKIYKEQMPKGGENGRDGWIDADYKLEETGEIVRFISRDVFDFGTYCFPKRCGGNRDLVFNQENWSETEKSIERWISEFGELKGIRM